MYLYLYKNFKYNNRYDYIKTFSTKQQQTSYFTDLEYIAYDFGEDYIRENEPFMVELSHEYLVENNINYIRYNNGYRDIFAFITEKKYINDEVTEIVHEIDVIQTYMFDFTMKNSFIERKKCTLDEITDFDEGLELGEHIIESEQTLFTKNYTYFAMFNGIKEQQVIVNSDGVVTNVIDMPNGTDKPQTIIDNIPYPLFFMPLKETYEAPILTMIHEDGTGGLTGDEATSLILSARKLIGKPYVWGGNYPPLGTDNGTDCSGLCMWAYNDAGLLDEVGLSGRWTTYTMIEHGAYISGPEYAKVGDVVFSAFRSPGVPEHVVLISGINGNELTIIEAQQEGVPILERTITFNSSTMEIRRLY